MVIARTRRLTLRPMAMTDLDDMAALLGDPEVMRYYPAPKSREEAARWITWNVDSYERHGFGLWVVETLEGTFVGDCGLTVQEVDGQAEVEIGYHVRVEAQGRGLATEAAMACRDVAAALGIQRLVAIVAPDNVPSQRVAAKLGMHHEKTSSAHGGQRLIYATRLSGPAPDVEQLRNS